jgi:large subunit ribosomal protein LX
MSKELKGFEVKGRFLEKGKEKKFTKTVLALNQNTAIEKVLALLGSTNKVKRRNIFVEEAKELKEEKHG